MICRLCLTIWPDQSNCRCSHVHLTDISLGFTSPISLINQKLVSKGAGTRRFLWEGCSGDGSWIECLVYMYECKCKSRNRDLHAVLDCIARALEISTDVAIFSRADYQLVIFYSEYTRPHTNDVREMSSLSNHFLRDLNDLGRGIEKRCSEHLWK